MVTEIQYINIRELLSRLTRHPLLQEVTLEQVVQYTIDFIGLFGLPKVYEDKLEHITIKDYRGKLPCDLIAINQVKNCRTEVCMRYMTDSFDGRESYENAFKTQGQIIYTSFKQGEIEISYKAIPVDEDGFPLLPDNSIFLRTLEAYIKKEVFTVQFDMGKISQAVLQNTQKEYAMKARQLEEEFIIPSVSEMESITRMWNTLIPRQKEFDRGFKDLGNREYIRVQ